jgi:phosphate transport system substrate-binding protein
MGVTRICFFIFLSILAGLLHGSCTRPGGERLVITGSSSMAPLIAEIVRRYEQAHPGARIDVQTGGTSRGIQDVRRGLGHIGMVSRALLADENDLQAHAVAWDGIALIVHAANDVRDLRDEEIAGLFTGGIRNWREVGGADAAVTVIQKAEGRATLDVFLTFFALRNAEVRADAVIGDNQQGIKTVAANPYAVGYVSIGAAEYEAAHGGHIRLLPLRGVAPTSENVAEGLCRVLVSFLH